MKKIILLLVFIFILLPFGGSLLSPGGMSFLFAQSYSGPESVEWDSTNNRWLISNITSHAILARSQSGTLTTLVPTTTNGPNGIEILNNVLYACCGGSIKGYNLTTGTLVFNLNLGGAFLNGLTTDGDSVLYATDFTNKDIFRINPTTSQFYTLSSNTTTTPNGIIYDGTNNRCIFVNWGANAPIKAIGLTSPYTITTITATTLSNCDGITIDHLGYYYVTAWGNNRMNRFLNDFTGGYTVMNNFILNGPADIDCKFDVIDTIGVPNLNNNTAAFIPLAPPITVFSLNDSTVCEGDQVTYTNSTTNVDSYSWTFPGGAPSAGGNSPISILYNTAGTYTTTITNTNVYGTSSSTVTIDVTANPVPVISAVGNVLSITTTFTSYQWYQNSILIPGATSQNYTITSGGDFYCEVTENGCTGISNTLASTLGTQNNFSIDIKIFPNPAAEVLIIEMILPKSQEVSYAIVDLQGRTIKASLAIFEIQGLNYLSVDLNGISNGVYILKLSSENILINKEFIVNK